MKILLVSNLYGARARGGAEAVVSLEAAGLRARGHEVTVVSAMSAADHQHTDQTSVPDRFRELIDQGMDYSREPNGVEDFFYFPPNLCFYTDLQFHSWLNRLIWHWLDIFNWRSAISFRRLVEKIRPNVVHTHNLMGLGFAIPSMLRRLHLRQVHTVHDVQLLHPSGLLPAGWQPRWPHEWLYIWLMRAMMGSPAVVIFPSDFMLRLHRGFGFFPRSKRVVIRNPSPPAVDFGDRSFNSTNNFLFVGQMEKHKGVLTLLAAWEQWSDRGTATLTLVGNGSLAEEVRQRVANLPSVTFMNAVYGEALAELYQRATFAVVPSLVLENAPMTILHALTNGTPVLAAASGGITELVKDEQTGLSFAPNDTAALLLVLHRAKEIDAERWKKMSCQAREAARQMSLDNHLNFLENVFENPNFIINAPPFI